jgi:hypothetical protein
MLAIKTSKDYFSSRLCPDERYGFRTAGIALQWQAGLSSTYLKAGAFPTSETTYWEMLMQTENNKI